MRGATGGNVHLACPFCLEDESKRGRLYVQTDGDTAGLFFCHRCAEKGGINKLRAAFGDPPLEEDQVDENWKSAKDRQRALTAAADYYAARLFESPPVLEYLKRERGLTEETIRDARLGFADGHLKINMLDQGIDMDALKSIGLVYPDGREFFQGYITIPYFTGGHVSLIRGRAFDHDAAKYKTPLGQSPLLYNSDLTFKTEGEITICEAEFDSLVLNQLGIPAVGVPGTTAWEDKWADYFKEFRRIFVMFDPDAPGKAGAERVANTLSPRARIVELPPPDAAGTKFDPTELYVSQGWDQERFAALLSKAKGGLLKTAQDAYDEWMSMKDAEGLKTGFDAMDIILHPGLLGGQVFILGAASGSGKSQPLDEPVLTPDGWKPIGELRVGDLVIGSAGQPVTVSGVFPQGMKETWRVTFTDGTSVRCSPDHLWTCRTQSDATRGRPYRTITAREMAESKQRWQVPACPAVEFGSDTALTLPAYQLGVLLGDGGFTTPGRVSVSTERWIADKCGWHYVRAHETAKDSVDGRITGPEGQELLAQVTALGLMGCYSYSKFIPEEYLRASIEDRKALLAGLLDTDGSVALGPGRTTSPSFEFSTSSEKMMEDFVDLCRSLGIRLGNVRSRVPTFTHNGEKRQGKPSWRVIGRSHFNPFTLPSKAEKWCPSEFSSEKCVRSVGRDGDVTEQVCISVDSPDHLYVTTGYTLTHNTIFLVNLMHRVTAINPDAKVLFISLEQTEHEWFERARRVYRFYNPTKGDVDALRYWRERIWIVDENVVSPQKMREIIEQFALETGQVPDLLVVDYLGYWARGFKGEAYERTSAAVMALKALAKEFRVPCIAPHQLSRTSNPGEEPNASSLRESGVVLETADFAAFMWAPDQRHGREADDMTGERLIRLSKSRHGGVGHLFRFRFAPISLVMLPEHEADVELAKNEISYNLIGDDFETSLWRHKTGVSSQNLDQYRNADGRLMTAAEINTINDPEPF